MNVIGISVIYSIVFIFHKCHFTSIQQTFTYSNSTIETLKKGMKYVQSKQLRHQNDDVVVVSLLLTLDNFTHFSSASIVDFEEVFG